MQRCDASDTLEQLLSTTVYPSKDQSGKECSDSLVSLTRSLACSVGRASDLHAEGPGFEF